MIYMFYTDWKKKSDHVWSDFQQCTEKVKS